MNEITKLIESLQYKGYIVPKNARFFKNVTTNKYYMLVGDFQHSCHVDTSNFYALLDECGELTKGNDSWWKEVYNRNNI